MKKFRFKRKFPICKSGPIGRPRQAVRNGQKIRKIADWNEIFRFWKNLPNWRLKNWPLGSNPGWRFNSPPKIPPEIPLSSVTFSVGFWVGFQFNRNLEIPPRIPPRIPPKCPIQKVTCINWRGVGQIWQKCHPKSHPKSHRDSLWLQLKRRLLKLYIW